MLGGVTETKKEQSAPSGRRFEQEGPRKLIIQIPCHNEAEVLPITLAELPDRVPGFDDVEVLVIDDGSDDETARVAREHGVDHVIVSSRRRGLAHAFTMGLQASVAAGADVIVNTDADNQYRADDIPLLVSPIVEDGAEMVVGERPIERIQHFSAVKKLLQRLGSWVVRQVSGTEVGDTTSGFRAFSRDAAMQLHVFNEYTYTLETIIQAGLKGMAVSSVPVRVNPDLRPSRLVESIPSYVRRQLLTIVRIFVVYKPFATFAGIGGVTFSVGFLIGLRFLYFYLTGDGTGHVQSLILAALLLGSGFALVVTGFVTDLIASNRKLLERLDWEVQRLRHE